MTAKGSPAWYAARRAGPTLTLDDEMAQRRATARAHGMFDAPAERHAFEAFFRDSRAGNGAGYVDRELQRHPERFFEYVSESTQRHWHTWQMALGGGKLLPKFSAYEIAMREAKANAAAKAAEGIE